MLMYYNLTVINFMKGGNMNMYKLTIMDDTSAIYDSANNPLPDGDVYFHTHQMLWKDNVQIGWISISKNFAKLRLGYDSVITIPREKFQQLFMNDATIIELIFSGMEVKSVRLITNRTNHVVLKSNARFIRLYQLDSYNNLVFFSDIFYTLK